MLPALMLVLILGQKFYTDDPVWHDNDRAVDASKVARYKLNDQYDFFQHSFGRQGDRSKAPAANVNTQGLFRRLTGR